VKRKYNPVNTIILPTNKAGGKGLPSAGSSMSAVAIVSTAMISNRIPMIVFIVS